jgi:hypothetical protein
MHVFAFRRFFIQHSVAVKEDRCYIRPVRSACGVRHLAIIAMPVKRDYEMDLAAMRTPNTPPGYNVEMDLVTHPGQSCTGFLSGAGGREAGMAA